VRMAADHFAADGAGHVLQLELAVLLAHIRVEHHLQEHIAQFIGDLVRVIGVDSRGGLIGFLNEVGAGSDGSAPCPRGSRRDPGAFSSAPADR